MIKRYNQFVTGKVNEDFDMKPEVDIKKPTLPSFGKKPQVAPISAPAEIEGEFSGEEEEVAVDKYEMALQNLADAAGVEFTPGQKSVEINGKEVTFPAETEKYHIKGVKKSFATPEDVLANIGGAENVPTERKQEVKDELTSIKDEEVIDPSEQFESKSYKNRRFKK